MGWDGWTHGYTLGLDSDVYFVWEMGVVSDIYMTVDLGVYTLTKALLVALASRGARAQVWSLFLVYSYEDGGLWVCVGSIVERSRANQGKVKLK